VGRQIRLYGTHRNGMEVEGHFKSTTICCILSDSTVETCNSIYEIVPISIF
jgi:hypothetical protein